MDNKLINNRRQKLPPSFKKYFWDCDFERLTLEEYPKFIMERILSLGNRHAIQWLFRHFSEQQIREISLTSRRLDKRTSNFWRIYFG